MFLKNTWYVCAQPEEINRTPMARTICNENIVFWRKEDGTPLAFEDRCCHVRETSGSDLPHFGSVTDIHTEMEMKYVFFRILIT